METLDEMGLRNLFEHFARELAKHRTATFMIARSRDDNPRLDTWLAEHEERVDWLRKTRKTLLMALGEEVSEEDDVWEP